MAEVYIKYNPYRLVTNITVDNKEPKKNSKLNVGNRRLQEWIDDLPTILCEECRTRSFNLKFEGTQLDYEDIKVIASDAKKDNIEINAELIPVEEVKDKEKKIKEIFDDILDGPFEELKTADVKHAFEMEQSSNFEVDVIATMSAGKSTLINALLGEKLMPTKQEACTAIITEIKDDDKPGKGFRAKVYDKDNNLIGEFDDISYDQMKELNSDESVMRICLEGDIPFVTSEDVSLVLVDTPGPNNSRNEEHRTTTYRMLSDSSKPLILYIMNGGQFGVNDDSELLRNVAERMKVGGKQSRDRFIFVVNKLDDFKVGEDSIEEILKTAKEYLSNHGIENPNIYPASALAALRMRLGLAVEESTTEEEFAARLDVMRFKNEEKHFEKYAPLPASSKSKIDERLESADDSERTLIHSGIVSIEEAIHLYVRKYAKTAKIKNIVDTFIRRLESAEAFEETKKQICENEDQHKEISQRINAIKEKLDSGKYAQEFATKIDNIDYQDDVEKLGREKIYPLQQKLTDTLTSSKGKITHEEAEKLCGEFEELAKDVQAKAITGLEEVIKNNVEKNTYALLETYKNRLAGLVEEINIDGIEINPLKIMQGNICINVEDVIKSSTKKERVKTGTRWVANANRKWYKPWTWRQKKGEYKPVYENQEYVSKKELSSKYLTPIQANLHETLEDAKKYANEQVVIIKDYFKEKSNELDKILKAKMNELESCTDEQKQVEEKLEESKEKLQWLDEIKARIDEVLDI